MNRVLVLLLVIAASAPLSSTQQGFAEPPARASLSITLPGDPMTFPPGRGSEIASSYCLICHSAEYVYMQPPHNARRWSEIVTKMKRTFGCPIQDAEIEPLARYLADQSAKAAPLWMAKRPGAGTGAPGVRDDHAIGKSLYERHCVTCHGATGRGDGPIGQALVPPAADLTSRKVRTASDEALLAIIANGKPPTAMPPWNNSLSPEEIHQVLAYVRSLSR